MSKIKQSLQKFGYGGSLDTEALIQEALLGNVRQMGHALLRLGESGEEGLFSILEEVEEFLSGSLHKGQIMSRKELKTLNDLFSSLCSK